MFERERYSPHLAELELRLVRLRKPKQQREYFPRNETIKRVARDATCENVAAPLSDFAMSGLAKSSALTAVHCRRPIEQLFPTRS